MLLSKLADHFAEAYSFKVSPSAASKAASVSSATSQRVHEEPSRLAKFFEVFKLHSSPCKNNRKIDLSSSSLMVCLFLVFKTSQLCVSNRTGNEVLTSCSLIQRHFLDTVPYTKN